MLCRLVTDKLAEFSYNAALAGACVRACVTVWLVLLCTFIRWRRGRWSVITFRAHISKSHSTRTGLHYSLTAQTLQSSLTVAVQGYNHKLPVLTKTILEVFYVCLFA